MKVQAFIASYTVNVIVLIQLLLC
uniref:Uncharacterized protein n=1 Tax=Anguilla anguilla TaxID=7936 RepID=A0A0E9XA50_ANGAN